MKNMKPTLVIMAAGMASRYGSMKQIQAFGPGGETIMDYSIYDAIEAGFKKVVFIIREDFAENFKNIFEPKLKGRIETEYVYQEMDAYLGNYTVPEGRTKPWGTSHAILCAKNAVQEPFAVINADDFYGKDAFAHNTYSRWVEKFTYLKSKTVLIFVSEYVKADYSRFIPLKRENFILLNFVTDEFFQIQPVKYIAGTPLKLVAIGNIKKLKNYELLIEAFTYSDTKMRMVLLLR